MRIVRSLFGIRALWSVLVNLGSSRKVARFGSAKQGFFYPQEERAYWNQVEAERLQDMNTWP